MQRQYLRHLERLAGRLQSLSQGDPWQVVVFSVLSKSAQINPRRVAWVPETSKVDNTHKLAAQAASALRATLFVDIDRLLSSPTTTPKGISQPRPAEETGAGQHGTVIATPCFAPTSSHYRNSGRTVIGALTAGTSAHAKALIGEQTIQIAMETFADGIAERMWEETHKNASKIGSIKSTSTGSLAGPAILNAPFSIAAATPEFFNVDPSGTRWNEFDSGFIISEPSLKTYQEFQERAEVQKKYREENAYGLTSGEY